jgi:hypothetical protein
MDSPKSQAPSLPLGHLVAIAVLYAIVNLWFLQHTGQSVVDLATRGGIGVFAIGFLASLEKLQNTTHQTLLTQVMRALLNLLAKPSVIVFCYGITLVVLSVKSSVTVLPSTATNGIRISEGSAVSSQYIPVSKDATHTWLTVNPFGSHYRIESPGFQPKTVMVYPLVSTTVNVEADLDRTPTLYIRLDGGYAKYLRLCKGNKKKCGTLAIYKKQTDHWCRLASIREPGKAFSVGWPRTPGADELSYWNLTYDAANLNSIAQEDARANAALKAKHLYSWLNPVTIGDQYFQPGQTFQLALFNYKNELRVHHQFNMPDKPIFDVFLTPAFTQGEKPDEIDFSVDDCSCAHNGEC